MSKIRLGFAPTQRPVFNKDEAIKYKRMIQAKLAGNDAVELVDIDDLDEDGLLRRVEDAQKVAKRFREKEVDAVFFPHCDFGTEAAVAHVAREVGKPVLLWGPRDDAPLASGARLRDSQCGLFATSKVLNLFGVPFTYITNSTLDSDTFTNGFDRFIAAARVVKAFSHMRIGQIGTRPGPFYSVIANEGELMEKFGIETVPITLVEIEKEVKSLLQKNNSLLQDTAAEYESRPGGKALGSEQVRTLAALKLVIADWAKGERLSAAAIQCWSALQASLGVVPCFINGELTGEGFPMICEADISGAVTSVMAQALTPEKPMFFADLTIRHPNNNNAELLWHCGNFPYKLAKNPRQASISRLGPDWGAIGNWELAGGDVTLCRFGGMRGEYSMLMGHGRATDGPYTTGTYMWVEFENWPMWENRFIRGPYIHHCTGVYGKHAPALYEACRYIPGLQPDCVQPTAAQLETIWMGE